MSEYHNTKPSLPHSELDGLRPHPSVIKNWDEWSKGFISGITFLMAVIAFVGCGCLLVDKLKSDPPKVSQARPWDAPEIVAPLHNRLPFVMPPPHHGWWDAFDKDADLIEEILRDRLED